MVSKELPFTPRLAPFSHQQAFLEEHSRRAHFGLIWEQGLGKSAALINNAALLFIEGEIDAVLVLAPNAVHRNWCVSQLPEHWPLDAPDYTAHAWKSDASTSKWHKDAVAALLKSDFPWLCMSYDSIMTDAGKQASWELLRSRRVLYILDESQRVKTPDAKRTKRVIASSVYAPYRRIASGTPIDTPLDAYAQIRFLDPNFWAATFGIGSFASFKAYFGIFETIRLSGGVTREVIKGYRNLDQLEKALKQVGQRVLSKDVLDLPPKTYSRLFHELTPAQKRAYAELRQEALTILDSGELVTAQMAMVLQLRLQQISAGHITPKAGAEPVAFDPNPRAALLKEILTDLTRPAIIWCQYREDVRVAAEMSRASGRVPVVFDGTRPELSVDVFQAGEAQDIIANLESGMTEGFTLNQADTTIYYSNTAKLIKRKQSEFRNWRIGQEHSVRVLDLMGEGTLDVHNLARLQKKGGIAGLVLGDEEDGWLEVGEEPADVLRELLE